MSRAVYKFYDRQTNELAEIIEFDLIDNPGCRAWQYAVLLNDKARDMVKLSPIRYMQPPVNINEIYAGLKDAVSNINQTEFPVEFDVPESFDQIDQDLMNRLHRHFTNSCYTLWDHRYHNTGPHQEFLNVILHELNTRVHEVEMYTSTPHKLRLIESYPQEEIHFLCDSQTGYDMYPFRKYHSFEHADLILDGYILGKTLLESFACDDDPTSWDTNGHMRTNGAAVVVMDHVRQQIYHSLEFTEWLRKHRTERRRKHADFPLGNFVAGHRSKMEALMPTLDKYSSSIEILL